MMSWKDISAVVKDCSAPGIDYQVIIPVGFDSRAYLQVVFSAPDAEGEPGAREWRSRKWRLSRHMTPSEVVRTCFLAAMTAQEHELRERFTFAGRAVFGPHIDVQALWAASPSLDRRDPS